MDACTIHLTLLIVQPDQIAILRQHLQQAIINFNSGYSLNCHSLLLNYENTSISLKKKIHRFVIGFLIPINGEAHHLAYITPIHIVSNIGFLSNCEVNKILLAVQIIILDYLLDYRLRKIISFASS